MRFALLSNASSSGPGKSGGNKRTGVFEDFRQAASGAACSGAMLSVIHKIEPDPASASV